MFYSMYFFYTLITFIFYRCYMSLYRLYVFLKVFTKRSLSEKCLLKSGGTFRLLKPWSPCMMFQPPIPFCPDSRYVIRGCPNHSSAIHNSMIVLFWKISNGEFWCAMVMSPLWLEIIPVHNPFMNKDGSFLVFLIQLAFLTTIQHHLWCHSLKEAQSYSDWNSSHKAMGVQPLKVPVPG